MNAYKVIASSPETAIVALGDADGRVHLARALTSPPPTGTPLAGAAPALGLVALRLVDASEVCPVAMVLLDCDPAAAVKLVHIKAGGSDGRRGAALTPSQGLALAQGG
jgi:hypothetical protein